MEEFNMSFYNSIQEQSRSRACCALNIQKRYRKNGDFKMKWEDEGANDIGITECQYAAIKMYEAFCNSYINWNMLNLALDRVEAASNGSWMFDTDNKK